MNIISNFNKSIINVIIWCLTTPSFILLSTIFILSLRSLMFFSKKDSKTFGLYIFGMVFSSTTVSVDLFQITKTIYPNIDLTQNPLAYCYFFSFVSLLFFFLYKKETLKNSIQDSNTTIFEHRDLSYSNILLSSLPGSALFLSLKKILNIQDILTETIKRFLKADDISYLPATRFSGGERNQFFEGYFPFAFLIRYRQKKYGRQTIQITLKKDFSGIRIQISSDQIRRRKMNKNIDSSSYLERETKSFPLVLIFIHYKFLLWYLSFLIRKGKGYVFKAIS